MAAVRGVPLTLPPLTLFLTMTSYFLRSPVPHSLCACGAVLTVAALFLPHLVPCRLLLVGIQNIMLLPTTIKHRSWITVANFLGHIDGSTLSRLTTKTTN